MKTARPVAAVLAAAAATSVGHRQVTRWRHRHHAGRSQQQLHVPL